MEGCKYADRRRPSDPDGIRGDHAEILYRLRDERDYRKSFAGRAGRFKAGAAQDAV